ncbi:hypothetical protein ABT160_25945 [Streptomyces sp. NPDC001941]|uniref:hypothetical protein n=1 Tax=Streptomyces sp. NPDC001941 TaxID=3154659 RepID=UPI00332CF41C
MLDERTAAPAAALAPEGLPHPPALLAQLDRVRALFTALPGLPEPSVTIDDWHVQVQFSHQPSHVVFPAVARVAALLRVPTEMRHMDGGRAHFRCAGQFRGTAVCAFASSTLALDEDRDVERADVVGGGA